MLSDNGIPNKARSFEEYLQQHYRKSTVVTYIREINNYRNSTLSAETATYKIIVDYIGELRKRGCGRAKLQIALQSIKQYYYYLLQTEQRKAHPCRDFTLKDKPSKYIQLQDLFTEKELELLLERKEHYKILEIRNRAIISLLIYQGMTTGELAGLTVQDIHLEKGTLDIKGNSNTNSRTIGLQTTQIMLLHQYLEKVRPVLASRKKANEEPITNQLILTWQGTAENGEGIHYLVSTFKKLFPGRNLNPRTLRQSVVTNLLKQGKDLRIVQVYMGHKSPDTTEKYKQSNVDELQAEINKYHPLK